MAATNPEREAKLPQEFRSRAVSSHREHLHPFWTRKLYPASFEGLRPIFKGLVQTRSGGRVQDVRQQKRTRQCYHRLIPVESASARIDHDVSWERISHLRKSFR